MTHLLDHHSHQGPDGRDATQAVADAVRSRVLPSLAAFFDQGLRLLACTEQFAAEQGSTPSELCGRSLPEVVGDEVHAQLIGPALRAVAGSTEHTMVRRADPVLDRQWLTLVGYQVDGEQLGVAVLTGEVV
ncbi:PAS domain-containing protein [Nocardioides sp. HDW12B]|uniref:PAS domain-containing protein n=1 Tax=Nocardioides sp. HDW12B TaxID=2714939 RepID=UPI00140BDFD9|nr:PAS domain-containing protein [Nocardioides sp. HDW12B]QIK67025.1 PAS domain-containing protein [Nocardioides sp. HDW12B]